MLLLIVYDTYYCFRFTMCLLWFGTVSSSLLLAMGISVS